MQCPACAAEVPAEAENRFCEECGAALTRPAASAATACVCGAAELDDDGFCVRCGRKTRAALASDHVEESLSPGLAAVSDRGLRHDRNEDRFALFAAPAGVALVVCDGVSATRRSEIASEAVAAGVMETLVGALTTGRVLDPETLLHQAIAAGVARLEATLHRDTSERATGRTSRSRPPGAKDEQAPSTTVVAALVTEGVVTVAWLGDSRAYLLKGDTAVQLTRDHSWQNEVVSAGTMSAEDAARAPQAHAITRWIGADAPADAMPEIAFRSLGGAGTLLLCTDGLWNYASSAKAMAELARTACGSGKDALAAGRDLVHFALGCGGQDNITAALLQFTEAGRGGEAGAIRVRDEES